MAKGETDGKAADGEGGLGGGRREAFQTTRWSLVLAAGASGSEAALAALEKLCRTYWFPLYSFARRSGRSPHDAEDLVQGFFARSLETDRGRRLWSVADPGRGRFRSFLLTAFKRFSVNEHQRATAPGGVTTTHHF